MKLKKLIAAAMVGSLTFTAPIIVPNAVQSTLGAQAEAAKGGARIAPKAAPAQPAAPQAQARPAAAIVPPNTGNAANNRRMNVVEPNAGSGGTDIIDIPAWMRRPR